MLALVFWFIFVLAVAILVFLIKSGLIIAVLVFIAFLALLKRGKM